MKRWLYLVAAACMAASVGRAQDETEVTIKKTQKAGDTVRYRLNATADVGGSEVIVERTVKFEIKQVKENGDVVATMSDQGGKINAMGQEMEVPLASVVTITTDKLGRIVKYQRGTDEISVMSPEVEQLLAMAQDYVLPEKPVKPKDTWQYEVANPVIKDKKVALKGTYLGMEKIEDTVTWKIKQTLTAVIDSEGGKMEAEMVFFADPADGTIVRAEGKLKNVPSQYGPVDIAWKAARLKADTSTATPK